MLSVRSPVDRLPDVAEARARFRAHLKMRVIEGRRLKLEPKLPVRQRRVKPAVRSRHQALLPTDLPKRVPTLGVNPLNSRLTDSSMKSTASVAEPPQRPLHYIKEKSPRVRWRAAGRCGSPTSSVLLGLCSLITV